MVTLLIVLGLALSPNSATQNSKADRILVSKSKRKLSLFRGNEVIKTYRIALGKNPEGHKIQQGDGRTPEGMYRIDYRNPESAYHLSLHISYPNKRDTQRAKELGVTPGGDIMIHGIKNGLGWLGSLHRFFDWTDGCIAVTNTEIEEIWALVPDGTLVEINP
jgi:murein L,D-transpeptidase YafK